MNILKFILDKFVTHYDRGLFWMNSRGNQGKRSCYAAGSSSQSRQNAEAEHLEFDNTRFIGPLQHARLYILVERQIWPEKIFTLNPQGDYCETLSLTPNYGFFLNASNHPVHFKRCDMNTKAQLYVTLLLYNIKPMSHTSTIPIDSACLLHYMIKGWKIDIAQVISDEIRKIAISGHTHGIKAPMTLAFPDLITGLCRKAGVDIPNVATKMISNIVNDDYVLRHCVPKLADDGGSDESFFLSS
ncbi:hypothetical protein RYX36_014399 [Vicia faba]